MPVDKKTEKSVAVPQASVAASDDNAISSINQSTNTPTLSAAPVIAPGPTITTTHVKAEEVTGIKSSSTDLQDDIKPRHNLVIEPPPGTPDLTERKIIELPPDNNAEILEGTLLTITNPSVSTPVPVDIGSVAIPPVKKIEEPKTEPIKPIKAPLPKSTATADTNNKGEAIKDVPVNPPTESNNDAKVENKRDVPKLAPGEVFVDDNGNVLIGE